LRVRWLAVLTCLLGVLALGATACGDDDDEGDSGGSASVSGDTLTIYSSLPLQGTSKGQSEAVISGERLALEQAGGKVGKYKINYVSLDDSTAQNPGTADEAQTGQNARKAVQDKTTIFYLGEFNSGGTKVSLPILNKANIPQISPSNTAVGLTTDEPGADTKAGEPDIYYPAQKRTYARVVPKDTIQGAALATIMKEDGCKSVHIFNDKTTYGAGLARNVESAAKSIGLTVEGNDGTDKTSANYRSLAAQIKADCFVGSGVTGENYVQVFKDVAAACPNCKLYGPDGVAEAAFTDPKEGGIPADVAARTKVTVATLSPEEFEKQGIQKAAQFFKDYEAKYGTKQPDPYAIYGYETMSLALDTLKAVGDKANDKEAVRAQLLENTKGRDSVLGKYDIDENGDTTLTDYGLYTIENGQLTFAKVIKAQGS
jgi:branched-chain amino acid transport system substrate-binding protein